MCEICFNQTRFSPIQFLHYSPPLFHSQLHVLFFSFFLASQISNMNGAGAHESHPCEVLLVTGDARERWSVFFRPLRG